MKKGEPVKLRQRQLADGRKSLFLDIYLEGVRRYEFLKLYLVPERSREDRAMNSQTIALAESIRCKRMLEVQHERLGLANPYKEGTLFLPYFKMLCDDRKDTGSYSSWIACLRQLEIYTGKQPVTFRHITPQWAEGFKDFLRKDAVNLVDTLHRPLAPNTQHNYYTKVCTCVSHAYKHGIIPKNPLVGLKGIKRVEVEREYLTLDELKAMTATPCKYPALKDAFLFSCLTGLRKSDILALKWGNVVQQGEYTRIIFRQKKTGGQEYLDISPQAVRYMGERGEHDSPVFPLFRYNVRTQAELRLWAARAGLTKDITFHCARHTFAVLMLDLGADIYTVQKLLGHKELATTQIYAKIMDKKKQQAVSLIPEIEL
ncbi:MAG: site-specific integrase [Bacteroidales bacterium]|nr:site-specific integrase [Bacteroides sp.]MCM1422156.1 site-specific integrase [Bacteroides sp.]MCM1503558.1 site-specific integrase [Bacteroidales bacterium]